MKDAPCCLRPRVDPPLVPLLENAPFLHSLVDALGVAAERAAPGRRRPTRSASWPTTGGIDVASPEALPHAPGCGFTGDRVMATGLKDPEFLWPAVTMGATVNVDSVSEPAQLADPVREYGPAGTAVAARGWRRGNSQALAVFSGQVTPSTMSLSWARLLIPSIG